MSTYQKAPSDVVDEVAAVMEKYHGGLSEAGVVIATLMARPPIDEAGDATGSAIKVNGYAALASVRILTAKDRVAYGVDVQLLLDSDAWDESSDDERVALIDHELTHLELSIDDGGSVKRDDAGYLKLRIRKHDFQVGWFYSVAQRHGRASAEVIQCRKLLESEDYHQCFLPGLEPVEA